MEANLKELADRLAGKIVGPANSEFLTINRAAVIELADSTSITFVRDSQHWAAFVASPAAAAVVSGFEPGPEKPTIVVNDAESAFAQIVSLFRPPVTRPAIGISPQAVVHPSAQIATDVDVYPLAYIGAGTVIESGSVIMPGVCILENCHIGARVRIFPNAVLYENTVVGDDSIIHAGVVLGAFGFGYKSQQGRHQLSAQLGHVEVGSAVELGANTTVDRGTFDATRIGDGTKVDNLVMIGHNCQIGQHNLLCSQVGIAGSCTTGNYVVMAGQVGIGDHLTIGDRAILAAKSGVMHPVPAGQTYLGIPATPIREQMQILAVKAKLPELRKQVKDLTARVSELSQAQESANPDLTANRKNVEGRDERNQRAA